MIGSVVEENLDLLLKESPTTKIKCSSTKVLIVVDCQNDFLHERGSLKCPVNNCVTKEETKQRLRNIDRLVKHFLKEDSHYVIFTRDWHPQNSNFFSDNPDFQFTWPTHCVRNTWGANWFFEDWNEQIVKNAEKVSVINKGEDGVKEEYSAVENPKLAHMINLFKSRSGGLDLELYVVGVASEFCVYSTYQDLKSLYNESNVFVVRDAIIPATDDIEFENTIETSKLHNT